MASCSADQTRAHVVLYTYMTKTDIFPSRRLPVVACSTLQARLINSEKLNSLL